jgi:CheY-like chemotaxis protein
MSTRKRILVVDDDRLIRNLLCSVLSRNGYDPTPAVDGSDGLTKACQERFDVVILDSMMPGMTGEHLADRLYALNCIDTSHVIMITGSAVPPEREKFAACLMKPFEISDVLHAIEAMPAA